MFRSSQGDVPPMTAASGSPKLQHPFFGYMPWTDRTGRISGLKTVIFLLLLAPALLLLTDTLTGNLGPRPWDEAIHRAGWWCVLFLLASLAVTPLRKCLRWTMLVTARRMIGVTAFLAAALHLVLYAGMEAWNLPKVASEIVLRFYLTIGFVALLGLTTLAATSTDGMIRRLGGKRWQRLHRLVYPIAVLALVHFFLQSKNDITEPLLFTGFFVWLMLFRLRHPRGGQPDPRSLLVLAIGSTAITAALEVLVICLKHNVPIHVMLAAQVDFSSGFRPAWGVLLAGLVVTVAAYFRKEKHGPARMH